MSRIHFVVYDRSSGAILRSGICTDETLEKQALNGAEIAIATDGFKDPDDHVVDTATATAVPLPD